jgi:predicted RNA-binding protein with EMAP domain
MSTTIINNYNELLDCFRDYRIIDINIINDDKLLVTCEALKKNEKITKPSQLGGFVLGYSRRIMLNYMKSIDPSLQSMIFTYTDTDSLHILGKDAEKLKELGYIKNKENAKLGFLCSDIDDEGIIVKEINLAPKTYFYEYIDNKNIIHDKDHGTFKCKGIPKK